MAPAEPPKPDVQAPPAPTPMPPMPPAPKPSSAVATSMPGAISKKADDAAKPETGYLNTPGLAHSVGWGTLGSVATSAPITLANNLYGKHVLEPVMKSQNSAGWNKLMGEAN